MKHFFPFFNTLNMMLWGRQYLDGLKNLKYLLFCWLPSTNNALTFEKLNKVLSLTNSWCTNFFDKNFLKIDIFLSFSFFLFWVWLEKKITLVDWKVPALFHLISQTFLTFDYLVTPPVCYAEEVVRIHIMFYV